MAQDQYTFGDRTVRVDDAISGLGKAYQLDALGHRCVRIIKIFRRAYQDFTNMTTARSEVGRRCVIADLKLFFETSELPYYVKHAWHERTAF